MTRPSLLTILWIIIGALVANSHHYFAHVTTLREIGSAALAIVLWPLLLVGISLHIR